MPDSSPEPFEPVARAATQIEAGGAEAGIMLLTGDGERLLEANEAAAELLGYTAETLKTMSPGELLAGPGGSAPWEAPSGLVVLRRGDGSDLPCHSSVGRLVLPEGERLVVSLQAAVEGKEEERLEALLRVAIDQLPEALVIYDTDDRLLYFNRSYHDFFPHMPPFEELQGRHFFDVIRHSMDTPGVVLDPLLKSDRQAYLAKRLRRLHEAGGVPFEQETAGRWHLVHEQRVPGVGFVAVRHDITEMKRLQQEMATANLKLAEAREAAELARLRAENANRSKSEFLAMMSHELRTPLNAILGFSSLLTEQYLGPLGNEKYQDYAHSIHDSGSHLLAIINDILDLAKVEAGKMEMEPEPLSARQLAEDCMALVRGLADGRTLSLEVDVQPPDLQVTVDRRAAKQMLVNLLSNACKFTEAGGLVRVEARPGASGEVLLRVADNGIGMSAEHIAVALEPFGQVGDVATSARRGTGLGLPLVKSFAELHGGRLRIDSTLGEGTTVTLAFPTEAVAP
jgi:two-component system cell cycle sensor histidine kinase PleC